MENARIVVMDILPLQTNELNRSVLEMMNLKSSSHVQQWEQTDGGLFKRFSQKFSDPTLEDLYTRYSNIITLSFHKRISVNGAIMTFGYGLYDYFFLVPLDLAQGSSTIRYFVSYTILVPMTGTIVIACIVLYTKWPKSLYKNHVLLCAWILTIWLWFGMFSDVFNLYDGVLRFRKKFDAATVQEQHELLLRPYAQLVTPNVFFILVLQALQSDFFVSLPTRTYMTCLYPLATFVSQLLVLDPATYLTSGTLMTLALYYTSICGALIGAISNDRFRRRNFYISYRYSMKHRDTMTAHGVTTPLHMDTLNSTMPIEVSLKTLPIEESDFPETQKHVPFRKTLTDDEIAQMVAKNVMKELKVIKTTNPIYSLRKGDHFYALKYLVNAIWTFMNRNFVMIHPNPRLEQRAKEKAAFRAFRVAASSFVILIISSLVSLVYCQLSPIYATYKYETMLRHCIVISCYLIGLAICFLGKNRVPLMKIEWIFTMIFIIASMGHLSAFFFTMNQQNSDDAIYFSTEVMAEYIVIYIALPKVVSLRYFSFYCFIMLTYAIAALFFSPFVEASARLLSDTFFVLPVPLIMAALGEEQRRLHLSEAQRHK